jgi:hypothetical protein
MAGYSETPLVRKLGIGEGARIVAINAPRNYRMLLGDLPEGVRFVKSSGEPAFIHLFVTTASDLADALHRFRTRMRPDGVIWVSWPKRSSKIPTDVTEDVIRGIALPIGLVDVKVCAVDETWSGLKLVIRKALRS